ncbi:hypothetical protein HHI36_012551 [Cryptolaemus montrouzieri]|uniref:Uncharacterized protein n=1 Tax=Cryptolaemus montrouzieri TaxID=559131 RepID=A0ABD2NEK1_9CUCU
MSTENYEKLMKIKNGVERPIYRGFRKEIQVKYPFAPISLELVIRFYQKKVIVIKKTKTITKLEIRRTPSFSEFQITMKHSRFNFLIRKPIINTKFPPEYAYSLQPLNLN